MEHLLQRINKALTQTQVKCFNPYFYGTSTSTAPGLFGTATILTFQSLFLWNIYFNIRRRIPWIYRQHVSILIFMEHLLQPC